MHLSLGPRPGKSTSDRVELRLLMKRQHDFRQGLLATEVDLKNVFDSVHREALWDFLRLCVIPARIIGLLTGL